MKKLIAALVLATSFAALADDAAKKAEPAKTEKKADAKHDAKHDAAAKPATTEKAPEKK
jgi:Ni/Co efflux regulator RcnB